LKGCFFKNHTTTFNANVQLLFPKFGLDTNFLSTLIAKGIECQQDAMLLEWKTTPNIVIRQIYVWKLTNHKYAMDYKMDYKIFKLQ